LLLRYRITQNSLNLGKKIVRIKYKLGQELPSLKYFIRENLLRLF